MQYHESNTVSWIHINLIHSQCVYMHMCQRIDRTHAHTYICYKIEEEKSIDENCRPVYLNI